MHANHHEDTSPRHRGPARTEGEVKGLSIEGESMPGHGLLMRFRVLLSEDLSDHPTEPIGPLFYRWLPDGESDRIEVPTGDETVSLRLWFERCGFVERGFVRFNYKRREVDPVVMSGQSPLNGGPLRGVIEFRGVSQEILAAIRDNRVGDSIYRSFGKRVVDSFLYPLVSRLIAVLRANYGQFWLPELRAWDSTRRSLGAYCRDLNLMWSDDEGQHWKDFVPDEPVYSFHAGPDTGKEYLGESEWRELRQAMMAGYEASTAARLIGRAHEVLEAGDLRYAAAEAVTALEVALGEVIRSRVTKDIADRVGSFWNLPIATRLAIAAALIGGIDEDQLRLAFRAIEVRRKVVHEGETPSRSAITEIHTRLQVAAHFVSGPRFRFPALPTGRTVHSEVALDAAF